MKVSAHQSWKGALQGEFSKPYFEQLMLFVKREYSKNICYPKGRQIFSVFNHRPLPEVKVVIIGQDPYHGEGQANGLCFSVYDGIPRPPSLVNIFRELNTDLGALYPLNGNLGRWASQEVLLLNVIPITRTNNAGSHQKQGWETFTNAVIKAVSAHCNHVIFMLWGDYTKKKAKLIDPAEHCILTAGHPSPLGANCGYWFGNRHFSQANAYLKANGKNEII